MAGTANITPSDGSPAGEDVRQWARTERARRQARRMAVPVGLLSLVLLVMAAPRFVGEMMLWPTRTMIADIQTGRQTDRDAGPAGDLAHDLIAGAAAIEERGGWAGDNRLIADGGLLLMRQAAMTADPAARADLLRRAVRLTEQGLRRAPAHPVAWTRLAALHVALGQPEKAAMALRLSLLSGPLIPQITASRLAQGLALLPYLDKDTRGLLARQARLLQAAQPEQLVALKTDAAGIDFIRRALSGDTAAPGSD